MSPQLSEATPLLIGDLGVPVSEEIRRAERQLNHTDQLMVTEARNRIVASIERVERMESALLAAETRLMEYHGCIVMHLNGESVPTLSRKSEGYVLSEIDIATRRVYTVGR